MNKLIIILILALPLFSYSQIDDLLKKTVMPDLLEEKSITTSIEDAYPVSFWLNDLGNSRVPVETDDYSFNLPPGYYRFTVQSYCLKAGTHGPTKGSGHLIAPIIGKRSDLVQNIISRSADNPAIGQRDIQLLLWSIIYGAKFTDLEPGLQLRVKPLLTDMEIAELSIGIKDVPLDILPDEIKSTAKFYKSLREKITNPQSTFEEIESMAVLPGDPPSDMLLKNIDPGNWAYAGDGFYMRLMPVTYYKSVLEVYRPGVVNTSRDEKNRIVLMERDGYKTEITYQDEPGSEFLYADNKFYPVYRFKTIKYSGPNDGEELVTEDNGWMIRGDGKEVDNPTGTFKNYPQDPSISEYKARLSAAKDLKNQINKYRKDPNKPGKGSDNNLTDNFNADQHFKDGMEAVKNPSDLKKKGEWINKNLEHTKDWWNCAINSLAGGSCDDNNQPKKFRPEKKAGSPGNTAGQRIAPSIRQYKE